MARRFGLCIATVEGVAQGLGNLGMHGSQNLLKDAIFDLRERHNEDKAAITELIEALQWFVYGRENGAPVFSQTYDKFKTLIEKHGGVEAIQGNPNEQPSNETSRD